MKKLSKQRLMNEIVEEVAACRKCRLWKCAKNPVPGEGNLDAAVMLIGEGPGYYEDITGRPFVGSAGKLLETLLVGIGLKRENVYIANVVKHRPPMNREPKPEEIVACAPYLERQIRTVKPKIVVTLGRHSTSYIFRRVGVAIGGISEIHGDTYLKELLDLQVRIIPTFHPAAALYTPKYRAALEKDFERIKAELQRLLA